MVRGIVIWIILAVVITLLISTWKSWNSKGTFSILKWSGYGILGASITTFILFLIVEIF